MPEAPPPPAPPPAARPPSGRRWRHVLVQAVWQWASRNGAIGPGDPEARRFGAFGPGSCLTFPTGAIFGERWIEIGRETLVGPYTSISAGMVPGQQMISDPVVRIGDRCMIGRGSHIVGHFEVVIGDDVQTGPYVYITDQNHGYENPTEVVHVQWPHDVPVRIGSGSWLGTGVVILPGTELGRNVVVGAGAVVRGRFPDHCVIAGVPARIVRRYDPERGWCTPGDDPAGTPSDPPDRGPSDARSARRDDGPDGPDEPDEPSSDPAADTSAPPGAAGAA